MSGLEVIQLLMDNLYQYMFNNWSTHTSKPCLALLDIASTELSVRGWPSRLASYRVR